MLFKIDARDVRRFAALSNRLDDPAFNITAVPFRGWDKFKKAEIDYSLYHVAPPQHLFLLGEDAEILNVKVSVSFGGTVSPTADGFQLSELLAQIAVQGHGAIVIGGGVIGVDMAAHLGALDVDGKTIAVVANPVARGIHPYNPKRAFLQKGILQQGGLLASEHDTPSDDRKERLLQRDRIITALSDIFIAVECSKDSGTVDAAKRAKIQGKKVIAIDWSKIRTTWHEPKTSGALQLIQEKVADPLPTAQVSDIRDPLLVQEFHKLFK